MMVLGLGLHFSGNSQR